MNAPDQPTVSAFVWASLTLSAFSALCFGLVIADGEGFLGPVVAVAVTVAVAAVGIAILGAARSRVKWPGIVALVLAAVPAFAPLLFLVFLIIVANR